MHDCAGDLNITSLTMAQWGGPTAACLLSCIHPKTAKCHHLVYTSVGLVCVYIYMSSLTSALDTVSCYPSRLSSLRSKRVAHQEEEAVPLQSDQPGVTPAEAPHPPGGLDPCSHPSHLCLPTQQTS